MLLENNIYRQQIEEIIISVGFEKERLQGKSFLITGAAGMLGSCIVDMLICFNEVCGYAIDIYAAGRNTDKISKRFGQYVQEDYFYIVQMDVTREFELESTVDYIIHAASNADPYMFANYPVDTLLANVWGANNLLDYARRRGVKRVLYVSSGEMYGQPNEFVTDGYMEDYCGYVNYGEARSCYPSGKRAAEVLCQSYIQQYESDVVIVRPCHCYGPTMTQSDSRALSQFFRKVLNGEDIVLKSSGSLVRSHCYVVDAVVAMLKVLFDGVCGEAYNIADPLSVCSIREVAEMIARQAQRKVLFDLPDDMEKKGYSRVTKAVLNADKLMELGWKPRFNLESGIRDTLKILHV